jgi:hypothetical protein
VRSQRLLVDAIPIIAEPPKTDLTTDVDSDWERLTSGKRGVGNRHR